MIKPIDNVVNWLFYIVCSALVHNQREIKRFMSWRYALKIKGADQFIEKELPHENHIAN